MKAVRGESVPVPPIWLMRQAGRYHTHYQRLRARHGFEELCREPELAAEVTLGPVLDFDFDAAILFSDLLFPLEALGFGLSYADGPPKLDGSLDFGRIAGFREHDDALSRLAFQRAAMTATRARLPERKALIGFVGGPWTLFVYAVEGTHAGALTKAKAAPDLYRAFADRMVPLLIENIRLQFEGGADVVMILDTAAGELSRESFRALTEPDLTRMAAAFPGRLGYYQRGETRMMPVNGDDRFAGVGIDWHQDLRAALAATGRTGFVQGNFEPARLAADADACARGLAEFLAPLRDLPPTARRGWVCGLGHGVLPSTPESNVRLFVETVRRAFA
jgi:uroporphyrinogen decarboxylase